MLAKLVLSAALLLPMLTLGAPAASASNPSVTTKDGIWIGTDAHGLESWLNIPFAQPPVGPLRFAAPLPVNKNYGIFDSTSHGLNCPQMNLANGAFNLKPSIGILLDKVLNLLESIPALQPIASYNAGEDCLNLMVQRPPGTTKDSKLPVMIWHFSGGFDLGGISMYGARSLIPTSVNMGKPVIFVAANSRTNSFGFLGGKEVMGNSTANVNAGLLDQRLAMRWVQENIEAFGGDPEKVTLFGESSGAISVAFHLLAKNGDHEGLFRAAIMESGSPLPVEGPERGQPLFDHLVQETGCTNAADRLACLRDVPYDAMLAATNTSPFVAGYSGIAGSYVPRTDGVFLAQQAASLIAEGKYARVPIISGNQYDEGTLFALGTLNISTTADIDSYLSQNVFPNTTNLQRSTILSLYPDDPTQGSPFDSGYLNILSPQNKRVNAIIGDALFQAGRRAFLKVARKEMPVWSYVSRVHQHLPILGSFHASDLLNIFGVDPTEPTTEMQSRWIAFANDLDPNVEGYPYWPKYGDDIEEGTSTLLQFSQWGSTIIPDTYRAAAIAYWGTIEPYLAF